MGVSDELVERSNRLLRARSAGTGDLLSESGLSASEPFDFEKPMLIGIHGPCGPPNGRNSEYESPGTIFDGRSHALVSVRARIRQMSSAS